MTIIIFVVPFFLLSYIFFALLFVAHCFGERKWNRRLLDTQKEQEREKIEAKVNFTFNFKDVGHCYAAGGHRIECCADHCTFIHHTYTCDLL